MKIKKRGFSEVVIIVFVILLVVMAISSMAYLVLKLSADNDVVITNQIEPKLQVFFSKNVLQ